MLRGAQRGHRRFHYFMLSPFQFVKFAEGP